jgi:hypothetical protein
MKLSIIVPLLVREVETAVRVVQIKKATGVIVWWAKLLEYGFHRARQTPSTFYRVLTDIFLADHPFIVFIW